MPSRHSMREDSTRRARSCCSCSLRRIQPDFARTAESMFCSETQRGAFTCSPSALTTKPMLLRRARRSAYPTRCSPSCTSRSACGCLKCNGASSLRRAGDGMTSNSGVAGTAGVGFAAGARGGAERGTAARGVDGDSIGGGASKSESCERASSAGPVRGMEANSIQRACPAGRPSGGRRHPRGDGTSALRRKPRLVTMAPTLPPLLPTRAAPPIDD